MFGIYQPVIIITEYFNGENQADSQGHLLMPYRLHAILPESYLRLPERLRL